MQSRQDNEVVYIGKNPLILRPEEYNFNQTFTLDDFVEEVRKHPSLGFLAHQRLHAALQMFGHQVTKRRHRWNWMDDLVDHPGSPTGERATVGIEYVGDSIMTWLKEACTDSQQAKKIFALVGPTGDGKTTIVACIEKALDAYGTLQEGAYHTIEADLSGYEDSFGGIKKMVLPCHENPLRILTRAEYSKIQEEINKNIKVKWQQLRPLQSLSHSAEYIISTLRKVVGKEKEVRDRLTVRRLYHEGEHSITNMFFGPTPEKDYNIDEVFGGELYMPNVKIFSDTSHPLVFNMGIGGNHNGSSAQGAIVHLSEIFRRDAPFLDKFLDIIQEGKLIINGKYATPLDMVFFGTSNLDCYNEQRKVVTFKEHLKRRFVIQPVRYITVLDDITAALERTEFSSKTLQDMHTPPHFVKEILGVLNVTAALEPVDSIVLGISSDKNNDVGLEAKMRIYNDEHAAGVERAIDALKHELERAATKKRPIEEQVEGVKTGINFSMFGEIRRTLRGIAETIEIDKSLVDERYRCCITNIRNLREELENIINTYSGINEETRNRLINSSLPLAWRLFRKEQARDALEALMGDEGVINHAAKYLAMLHAVSLAREQRYYDPKTQTPQQVSKEFLDRIHKSCKEPDKFTKYFVEGLRHRLGSNDIPDTIALAKLYLNENPSSFRMIIFNDFMQHVIPREMDSTSTAYNPRNIALIQKLIDRGYCRSCAPLAINAAEEERKIVEK